MDVNKATFAEVLPLVKDALGRCTFYAVDTELTGLDVSRDTTTTSTDSLEERYQKLKQNAKSFAVTQYGLSAFIFDEQSKSWTAETFNFWLFPSPYGWSDVRFHCQASSLEFLSKHKFDFNKFVYEGIPYLSQWQQQKMKPKPLDAEARPFDSRITISKPADLAFIDNVMKRIGQWMKSDEPRLELEQANSFLRRLIRQEVFAVYGDKIWIEAVDEKPVLTKVLTASDREQKKRETQEQMMRDYDTHVGFGHVVNLMIESRKPLICHNGYLDLLHTYNHFVGYLPAKLDHFKLALHNCFHTIVDTKFVSNSAEIQALQPPTTALGDLYTFFAESKSEPRIEHAVGFDRYRDSDQFAHEAGYDAWMTGFIFLRMLNVFNMGGNPDFVPFGHSVAPFINRVNLMRADVPLRIKGPQEEPSGYLIRVRSSRTRQLTCLAVAWLPTLALVLFAVTRTIRE